jgi:hypothetical protein
MQLLRLRLTMLDIDPITISRAILRLPNSCKSLIQQYARMLTIRKCVNQNHTNLLARFQSEGELSPIHVTASVKILTRFKNSGEPGVSSTCELPITMRTSKFRFAAINSTNQQWFTARRYRSQIELNRSVSFLVLGFMT